MGISDKMWGRGYCSDASLTLCCQAMRRSVYCCEITAHASKRHFSWAVIVAGHTGSVNSNGEGVDGKWCTSVYEWKMAQS